MLTIKAANGYIVLGLGDNEEWHLQDMPAAMWNALAAACDGADSMDASWFDGDCLRTISVNGTSVQLSVQRGDTIVSVHTYSAAYCRYLFTCAADIDISAVQNPITDRYLITEKISTGVPSPVAYVAVSMMTRAGETGETGAQGASYDHILDTATVINSTAADWEQIRAGVSKTFLCVGCWMTIALSSDMITYTIIRDGTSTHYDVMALAGISALRVASRICAAAEYKWCKTTLAAILAEPWPRWRAEVCSVQDHAIAKALYDKMAGREVSCGQTEFPRSALRRVCEHIVSKVDPAYADVIRGYVRGCADC